MPTAYKSSEEAKTGLTSAFTPASGSLTPQQQEAINRAASLVPNQPSPVTPPQTAQTPTAPATPAPAQTATQTSTAQKPEDKVQSLIDTRNKEAESFQLQAANVQKTIENINNGSTPLSAAETAQIDGLKQQFQQLIEQQKLININSQGVANIRGYQKGAAEYDPNFQIKTIGAIITGGQNKIADLQIKEADAVARLTQSFRDDDIKGVKDAWDVYKSAYQERQDALKETISATQAAIKEENDKLLEQLKLEASEAKELQNAKNDLVKIASNNNAPAAVRSAILNAPDLASAYEIAGNYSAGGTGIVAEFNYAKANGYTGSFAEYQNEDANRKRTVVNINSGGLTPQENSTFLTVTNKYQADPVVNSAIKGEQIRSLANQIIADPADATNQLASLYILVKNLDPDSAVREGELALANQTQSYLQTFNNSLTRIVKGQVLAPDAARALAEATKKLVGTWETTADKKTKMYQSQASNSSPNVGNAFNKYLTDFQELPSPEEIENESKQNVIEYGKENPDAQAQIKQLAGAVQPELGRAYTWEEIYQIINTTQ